jgi:hypothetical protein
LCRAAQEKEVRPVTNFVQGWPKTTNADRVEMGITVRDTSPTPALAPTSRLLAAVDSGQRLTHTLHLSDESTPARRARPCGLLGAEVCVKLVTPGTGHQGLGTSECSGDSVSSTPVHCDQSQVVGLVFLTKATRPSVTASFEAAAGGKTAVYMLRWVSTRGEKGPWSDVTTATVAA